MLWTKIYWRNTLILRQGNVMFRKYKESFGREPVCSIQPNLGRTWRNILPRHGSSDACLKNKENIKRVNVIRHLRCCWILTQAIQSGKRSRGMARFQDRTPWSTTEMRQLAQRCSLNDDQRPKIRTAVICSFTHTQKEETLKYPIVLVEMLRWWKIKFFMVLTVGLYLNSIMFLENKIKIFAFYEDFCVEICAILFWISRHLLNLISNNIFLMQNFGILSSSFMLKKKVVMPTIKFDFFFPLSDRLTTDKALAGLPHKRHFPSVARKSCFS